MWAVDQNTMDRIEKNDQSVPVFMQNPYRYEHAFKVGKDLLTEHLSAPVSISWSLTAGCNSRCSFCCTDSINAGSLQQEATLEEVENIVSVLMDWKVPRIILGGGEPLVRPDIRDIFSIFRQNSFRPVLATNGILLSGDFLRDAAETCMNIQISLDTLEPAVYRKLRGVDALAAVKKNLLAAVETGVLVRAVTVLTTENLQELEKIGRFLADAGIRQWFIFEMLASGRGADTYDSLHIQDKERVSRIIGELENRFPSFSIWYWGSQPADGCSIYVVPEGRLALTDYHTNQTMQFPAEELDLQVVEKCWMQIREDDKKKMLDNFLAGNRLREVD
jgi:sulfatase maturation enzyme AslB (radical SAM superfamily)